MINALENQEDPIAWLCCMYGLDKLFAFATAIHDDCRTEESDLDLLVELAPIGGYDQFHATVLGLNGPQAFLLREP